MEMDTAKQSVEQERKNRIDRCRSRLEQLLADFDCRLEAIMHVTSKGVFPQIMIVPRQSIQEGTLSIKE